MRTNPTWRLAVAATALFLLAGCSGVSPLPSGVTRDAGAPAPAAAPADMKGGAPAGDPLAGDERQVARTASVTLVVDKPVDAAAHVRRVASDRGGYVTREDVQVSSDTPTAQVVISVPADQLDAALTDLAALGTLVQRAQTATDVTDRVVDVDARVRTLQDSITRIRALMDRAGTVTEIAAVERELTTRQSELESLLAQQKALRSRVDRTPITVTLTSKAPVAQGNPFLDGLLAAWHALQDSVRLVLTAVGALLPWAVLGLAVGLPVRAWLRRRTPRPTSIPRKEPTRPAAASTHEPPRADPSPGDQPPA